MHRISVELLPGRLSKMMLDAAVSAGYPQLTEDSQQILHDVNHL